MGVKCYTVKNRVDIRSGEAKWTPEKATLLFDCFILSWLIFWVHRGYFTEFRVRVSDPWEKSAPRKISEFYFGLNIQKLPLQRGRGEVASVLVLLLPKMQNCPLIFQKCFFVSWNLPFIKRSFLKNAQSSSRIAL